MRKNLKRLIVVVLFVICYLGIATTANAATFIREGKVPDCDEEDFDITVKTPGLYVLFLQTESEFEDEDEDVDFDYSIYRDNEDYYYSSDLYWEDSFTLKKDHIYFCYKYIDKPGKYNYWLENDADFTNIKYELYLYSGFPEKVIVNDITLEVTKSKPIVFNNTPTDSFFGTTDYKMSNSSICSITADKNMNLTVHGDKVGKTRVTLYSANNEMVSFNVNVVNPKVPRFKEKKVTLCKGDKYTNPLYTSSKIKWSSSNKKVATVNSKGKVTAKSIGRTTITAKVGKKKYSYKVKVEYQYPNFNVSLDSYNTRGNYFVAEFKNYSNKPLTIYSSGAKALDDNFKSYDRNLRLTSSTIKIRPKSKMKVKFYVKGRVTWYNVKDFTIYYKFKFDDRTYNGRFWYAGDSSAFKIGKKWYYTY